MRAAGVCALAALISLAGCRDEVAQRREALIRTLHQGETASEREDAAYALGEIRGKSPYGTGPAAGVGPVEPTADEARVIDELTRALRAEPVAEVRNWIVWALHMLRPPGRQPALVDCARNDAGVALRCVDALLSLAHPEDIRELIGMLGTEVPGAGWAAIGLDKLGDSVVPDLGELIEQEVPGACDAMSILRKIGSPEALSLVAKGLVSRVEFQRYYAIFTLELVGAADAFRPQITPLLNDRCADVRVKAAKALGVSVPATPPPDDGVGCDGPGGCRPRPGNR